MAVIHHNLDFVPWWVYILLCSDGTFYTGSTNDLKRRLKQHNYGEGAKYTRARRPVFLQAFFGPYLDRSAAQKVEYCVKKYPRLWKAKVRSNEDLLNRDENYEKLAETICT